MAHDLALPHLPNKRRGVPRVDDRRVLNGISWFCVRAHAGAIRQNVTARRPRSLQSLQSLVQSRRLGSAQLKDVITKRQTRATPLPHKGHNLVDTPRCTNIQIGLPNRGRPHIDGPASTQATSLESQMIYPILLLPGRTLTLLEM